MIVRPRPNGLVLFFALRGSILPRIATSLLACTALAVVVTFAHGVLFQWKVTLTPVPFSLLGLALSIFLGFRNTVSYERFWEARKLWGELIVRSRSFARQVVAFVPPSSPPNEARAEGADALDDRAVAVRRIVAFAHALRCQLRGVDAAHDVGRWLPDPAERAALAAAAMPGDHLLARSTEDVARWHRTRGVAAPVAVELDQSLTALAAVQAGCERIASTPVPFAYTLLLHRTAYLYCFLLPFGLVDVTGMMTPAVVAIVAYAFFGLDALGDEIERPFGLQPNHLPLDALCRTVEISLLQTLGERELPAPIEPANAVLL